jgi:hypothetical protein
MKGEIEGILDIIGYYIKYYEEVETQTEVISTKSIIRDLETIRRVIEK